MSSATLNIHAILIDLMKQKSIKDQATFSISQLSKALNMPHSMIVKLLHKDPAKRVENPRIETLKRIVDYFKNQGFAISLDDFFAGTAEHHFMKNNPIHIHGPYIEQFVDVYSLNSDMSKCLGKCKVLLSKKSVDIIAFISETDIKPIFKKGSLFIIDTGLNPTNNTLVAVKSTGASCILIRKYYFEENKIILEPLNSALEPLVVMPTESNPIIGVVTQVNAKT